MFFFEGMETFWDGSSGRILLGDAADQVPGCWRWDFSLAGLFIQTYSPYMNTQFRLALVLPERNCCLIRGVCVAYLFTQNLSLASCVCFYACHMNQRL